jgi:hypothetical protein
MSMMSAEETLLTIDQKPSRRIPAISFYLACLCFLGWVGYLILYTQVPTSIKIGFFRFQVEHNVYVESALWLWGFCPFVLVLLYDLFGTESVHVTRLQLVVIRTLFGFSRRKAYDLTLMRNLQVISKGYWLREPRRMTYVLPDGHVHFLYRDKPCEFGATLSDDEAFDLVHHIQEQISRLGG